MKSSWEGHYLDGRSSVKQPVFVQPLADALKVWNDNGISVQWPYHELKQTQGFYTGEPVYFEREGGYHEGLLVSDSMFLTALHQVAAVSTSHLHNPASRPSRAKFTFLAGLAVVGFVGIQYFWGIPVFGALATSLVPITWEERLGQEVMEHFAPPTDRCTDPSRLKIITDIVLKLTGTVENNPYTFRVIVLDYQAVNAFAIPGGNIVVLRGLLEMTRTPEELAGVLAHEAQHILNRHSTRIMLEQVSTGILVAAILGDPTGIMAIGLEGARTLGMLRYSRKHEAEADTKGMQMLVAAGINPQEMIAFYQLFLNKERDSTGFWAYLSTHPRAQERIDSLESLAEGMPNKSVKLFPYLDWTSIRTVCHSSARGRADTLS